jgi:hypothetical protein
MVLVADYCGSFDRICSGQNKIYEVVEQAAAGAEEK